MNHIIEEIKLERQYQDKRFGGPEADDKLTVGQWAGHFAKQIGKLLSGEQVLRHTMIKIAALALAAIESNDRKTGRTPQ